jgi:U4/U6.U5 tri-snRNP component SNU23
VERAALAARDFELDLASKAGQRMVVGGAAPKSRQGGYYCAVCDCTLADSGSYLTHLNGRWHNRALGMSMSVERASAADVRGALAAAAARKRAASGRGGGGGGSSGGGASDRGDELDRQLLLTAGPAGDEGEEEGEEEGEGKGEGGKSGGGARPAAPATGAPPPRPPPAPTAAADDDDDGIDPELAAAMGFAGFGTSSGR